VESIRDLRGEVLFTLRLPWPDLLSSKRTTPKRRASLDAVNHLVLSRHQGRKPRNGGYVPVPFALVQKIAGDKLGPESLRDLVGIGAIECDHAYRKGERCNGYRFSEEGLSFGFTARLAPQYIAQRLQEDRAHRTRVSIGAEPAYEQMWSLLKKVRFAPEVWPALERHFQICLDGGKIVRGYCALLATHEINQRRWLFTYDPDTGRCFNNVSNYPKVLRPFLVLDGEPTGECDIANSQPLLLAALAYGHDHSEERTRFVELVTSGQFYETLGAWAGFVGKDRGWLKGRVYSEVLFGHEWFRAKMWNALATHFPHLAAYIDEVKCDDHRQLALLLQRKEAEVIVHNIIPRLTAMGIDALSIHDGCLSRAGDVGSVMRVMEEEVEAAIGIKPLVRVKSPSIPQAVQVA